MVKTEDKEIRTYTGGSSYTAVRSFFIKTDFLEKAPIKPEISKKREVKSQNQPVKKKEKVKENAKVNETKILSFNDFVSGDVSGLTRSYALKRAISLWGHDFSVDRYLDSLDDDEFFRFASKRNGFEMKKIYDPAFKIIKSLNIPVILRVKFPQREDFDYVLLKSIRDGKTILMNNDEVQVVSTFEELKSIYSGIAYVPWKDFLNYPGTIPINAPRESIITLKMLLKELGFEDIKINAEYDDETREAIEIIQAKYGLKVDGIVGPLTK